MIDLHSHSAASDGTEPPAEVVRRAALAGLDVIALTDHDTVAGIAEAARALPPGLTLVPGMELSCARDGQSVHLLAYLFDPDDPDLARECALIRDDRIHRAEAMVARIVALGVPLTMERVRELAGDGVVGRPHIARALVEAGAVGTFEEAFTPDWIGPGGRAHVSRYALDPVDAVRLTRAAGGVPVLAHPGADNRAVPDDVIAEMAAAGLFGLEIDHRGHDPATRDRLRALAARLDLAVTGSSDDHGELTGHILGSETTAPEVYDLLVAEATGASPLKS
ncbi:PHP domain-containing protein [Bailinhaonella thermotolerans]|uniref:PHP domain-containing protein n=1 Tax=Bailinhaonella thermotolerans TaxID=1070861 RepID=A0A3A4AVJ3_9ACTN|nr:PHP domain-containing protein [Bailinhaonella thermotolerans]